ncbi:TetR family transcriptional regulator [Nocardia sp. NPDC051900]|uniref:TetR family transcriptional regulator n=1 Tax=Nocardia sp. NPDC051900 TaxID=3364326 RepID=UPI00378DF0DD
MEDGYAATTTNKIAELAGVSIGTLLSLCPRQGRTALLTGTCGTLPRRCWKRPGTCVPNSRLWSTPSGSWSSP